MIRKILSMRISPGIVDLECGSSDESAIVDGEDEGVEGQPEFFRLRVEVVVDDDLGVLDEFRGPGSAVFTLQID